MKRQRVYSIHDDRLYMVKKDVARETIRRGFINFLFSLKTGVPSYIDLYDMSVRMCSETSTFKVSQQLWLFETTVAVLVEQIERFRTGTICWEGTTTVLYLLKCHQLPRQLYPMIMEELMIPIEKAVLRLLRSLSYMERFYFINSHLKKTHSIKTAFGTICIERMWSGELVQELTKPIKELLEQ